MDHTITCSEEISKRWHSLWRFPFPDSRERGLRELSGAVSSHTQQGARFTARCQGSSRVAFSLVGGNTLACTSFPCEEMYQRRRRLQEPFPFFFVYFSSAVTCWPPQKPQEASHNQRLNTKGIPMSGSLLSGSGASRDALPKFPSLGLRICGGGTGCPYGRNPLQCCCESLLSCTMQVHGKFGPVLENYWCRAIPFRCPRSAAHVWRKCDVWHRHFDCSIPFS